MYYLLQSLEVEVIGTFALLLSPVVFPMDFDVCSLTKAISRADAADISGKPTAHAS